MDCLVECAICKEPFNSADHAPLVLYCGHTFCKQCINQLSSSHYALKCPLDRLPEIRRVSAIPLNYIVLQLSDFQQTGFVARERCSNHDMPVALVCKTCRQLCCVKCVRQHQPHELYDMDHPTVYKDIDDSYNKLLSAIESSLGMTAKRAEALKLQVESLDGNREKSIVVLDEIFEGLLQSLMRRKQELLSHIHYHYSRMREEVNQRQSDHVRLKERLEKLSLELHRLKNAYASDSNPDRTAVFYSYLINFRMPETPTITSSFNIKSYCLPELTRDYGIQINSLVKLNFSTPLSRFKEEFEQQDYKLTCLTNRYKKAKDVDKVLMEVSSTSAALAIDTADLQWARWHLMLSVVKQVFNEEYDNLPKELIDKIKELTGPANCSSEILRLCSDKVKDRYKQVTALYYGLKSGLEENWSEALETLQWACVHLDEYRWADRFLNVICLRLCTIIVNMLRHGKSIESLPLVDLVCRHLLLRTQPNKSIYRQIFSILKAIFEFVEVKLPGIFFPYFQERFSINLKDLEYNNRPTFKPEIPAEMQAEIELTADRDFFYWTNDEESLARLREVIVKATESWEPWFMQLCELQNSSSIFPLDKVAELKRC